MKIILRLTIALLLLLLIAAIVMPQIGRRSWSAQTISLVHAGRMIAGALDYSDSTRGVTSVRSDLCGKNLTSSGVFAELMTNGHLSVEPVFFSAPGLPVAATPSELSTPNNIWCILHTAQPATNTPMLFTRNITFDGGTAKAGRLGDFPRGGIIILHGGGGGDWLNEADLATSKIFIPPDARILRP